MGILQKPTILKKISDIETDLGENLNKIQTNFVNVKYPPIGYTSAKGDGATDDTSAIQSLINDFPNIFFPNGTYVVSTLVLKANKNLIGQHVTDTKIKAKQGSSPHLMTLDIGAVQRVRVENLYFQGIGALNPNQNGLYFKAQPIASSPYHGGLWTSVFKNVLVNGFDGIQLALLGGSNTLLPNQFISFERVDLESTNDVNPNSLALLVEGQTEQISWTQCAFYGKTNAQGTVAIFRRERDSGGNVVGDLGGNANTFIQCYCGTGYKGIVFERSMNIRWYGGYFENLKKVIDLTISALGVVIENSEFRESGVIGDGTGYIVYCDNGNIEYKFLNNTIATVPEKMIKGTGIKTIKGNYSASNALIPIDEIDGDVGIETDNSLIVKYEYMRVQSVGGSVQNVYSYIQGNHDITLVAWNAAGFSLITGGNINIGKTITLAQYDYVNLTRLGNQWIIKSIIRATDYKS